MNIESSTKGQNIFVSFLSLLGVKHTSDFFNPHEIGVVVAIKFPYVNQALPILTSNKIFNILFLF